MRQVVLTAKRQKNPSVKPLGFPLENFARQFHEDDQEQQERDATNEEGQFGPVARP